MIWFSWLILSASLLADIGSQPGRMQLSEKQGVVYLKMCSTENGKTCSAKTERKLMSSADMKKFLKEEASWLVLQSSDKKIFSQTTKLDAVENKDQIHHIYHLKLDPKTKLSSESTVDSLKKTKDSTKESELEYLEERLEYHEKASEVEKIVDIAVEAAMKSVAQGLVVDTTLVTPDFSFELLKEFAKAFTLGAIKNPYTAFIGLESDSKNCRFEADSTLGFEHDNSFIVFRGLKEVQTKTKGFFECSMGATRECVDLMEKLVKSRICSLGRLNK